MGGLAAVTALVAFGVLMSMRSGISMRAGQAPLWAVPLVAGAAVGVLSWFLLSGVSTAEEPADDRRIAVACAHCGNTVLEDWRICPHCGSTSNLVSAQDERVHTA
jgi:hypothetical protein